ncbi:nuclear transport factor 2 family protein [Congregibacter litoralis]|uniref:nuclear transport factor 2 family protein n=1 Tax=Congregibacter litoralis TaxID=393662 RepID=UPI00006AB848|nr:nuclear transport factor 2 family protein [Congregibacter litoralis]
MKAVLSTLLTVLVLMFSSISSADDIDGVRAAVFDYFEGINEVSEVRLKRAFADTAALKSVGEKGDLRVEPISAAIGRWLAGTAKQRRGSIVSVDLSGYPIARVVFDFDGAYTDFLTLAKLKGQWKIIDKVFIATPSCCESDR